MYLKKISLFYLFLLFFVFIFWPPWTNPIKSIVDVFLVLKQYPFVGKNFILGEYISRFNLPWYYVPLWIGITTPLTFILLFLLAYRKAFDFFKKITEKNIY